MELLRMYFALLPLLWAGILAQNCGKCGIGKCVKGSCLCPSGFWGSNCQYGRKRLTKSTGFLSDYAGDYVHLTKISWFIESQRKNSSIEFSLDSFATECAWDHVYIYDGLSIYDPLIAALSGKINQPGSPSNNTAARKILAKSGSALVHFYSDKHLQDAGFNITYRISNCSSGTCSGRGYCNDSNLCECNDGWTGTHCSIRKCCPHESYNLASNTYNCPAVMQGSGCPTLVAARASHAAVIQDNVMWVYGGYSFDGKSNDLLSYNIVSEEWSVADPTPIPKGRFGHSIIFYDKQLYIFGGIKSGGEITNELWKFDTQTKLWSLLKVKGSTPVSVTGHASVIVFNQMYIFMGYSSERSYCACVQQLDLATLEWKLVKTKGALVTGTFGHSAVYDRATGLVFIYGGFSLPVDSKSSKKKVSDSLFSFNPTTKYWKVLPSSKHQRMLHSSVIVGRMLVIYGGSNHHHEAINDAEKKCYSHNVVVYNIDCGTWKKTSPNHLFNSLGRYGHTAVQYNRTMYVFGGFDGIPQNDVIPITIGNCSGYSTRTKCLQAPFIVNCVWNKVSLRCLEAETSILLPKSQIESPPCNATMVECRTFQTCETCLSNTVNCAWCDGACKDANCANDAGVKATTNVDKCGSSSLKFTCTSISTCYSCELHPNCTWSKIKNENGWACTVAESKILIDPAIKCNSDHPSESQCHLIKNCSRCTAALAVGCMWCQSQKQCIDSNAYFINFPFGQCLEWINSMTCQDVKCSGQNTCQSCFALPGCGWCADSRSTGIGMCLDGTNRGALNAVCPASRWYYTECPSCQCNGHSQCANRSACIKCENNTIGTHCEKCKPWYHGEALYNGTCKKCQCNKHGLSCDSKTGKCECDTAGIIGDQCESCDYNSYFGNATNGGFCFYRLIFGFEYNFNKTNKNYNFLAVPPITGKPMTFEVAVKHGSMLMNFSYTSGGVERFVVKQYRLGAYGKTFSTDHYKIKQNREPIFKIYIYNLTRNSGFRISFDQDGVLQPNWLHFLIVFLICFCSLLIILIVVWKLKQQYSNYQYNRRRRVELHEMASRPFSAIKVYCNGGSRRHQKVEPSQIGLEPFAHSHLAVASVLIELPRSETGFSPKGQSGLCIGSTVIQHKHQNLILNAQHQLCMFKERQKRHRRHPPVNV